MRTRRSAALACGAGVLVGAWACNGDLIFDTVALSGDAVPSAPGVYLDDMRLAAPQINNAGVIGFMSLLRGDGVGQLNNRAFFFADLDGFSMALRSDDQITGAPDGTRFAGHDYVPWPGFNLAPGREAVMLSGLQGSAIGGENDRAILRVWPDSARIIAQSMVDPLGDIPFRLFDYRTALDGNGEAVFLADHSYDHSLRSIWTTAGDDLIRVAMTGTEAPGMDGATYGPDIELPVTSDDGWIAYRGSCPDAPPGTRQGLWGGLGPSPEILLRSGAPAPGVPDHTILDFASPSITRDGRVVVQGRAERDGVDVPVIWQQATGGFEPVVVVDDSFPFVPDGSEVRGLQNLSVNASGDLAFNVTYTLGPNVTPETSDALYTVTDGVIARSVRGGDTAPDCDGDVRLRFGGRAGVPIQNDLSQIAFLSLLYGDDVTDDSDVGIFALDPVEGLMKVVREGDLFEVADGDFRQIATVDLQIGLALGPSHIGTGGVGGVTDALNDHGRLAFYPMFADGSHGIFTTTIPAPGVVLALGLFPLVRGRRRP